MPSPPPRSRGGSAALLIGTLALAVSGVALWRAASINRGAEQAVKSLELITVDVEGLRRSVETERRERDQLRQRLIDAENVNKSLREEVLGVSERARVLEDAIANVTERHLSGHDAMMLEEAETVLLLAKERFELFNDAASAVRAYAIADAALATVTDPAFAAVRETVAVEQRALQAVQAAPASAGIAELERIRAALPSLPPASPVDTGASQGDSRLWRVLGQFVRVSRVDAGGASPHDVTLLRGLIGLDLRAAELALLERNPQALQVAVKNAKAQLSVAFDAQAVPVKDALSALGKLQAATPATPPELGAALAELRRLRATNAERRRAPTEGEPT
ncbi:uroporphyrinogen-III C-methyltransferase [Tahibacter amnicola]|uniref:Uroporphyrinogen-III C-methyltransferase n=1 Tax=Tahibacter amnicola TaxID=2976241 RepID=A0ABY6BFL8_9GAMM|nr:uroporphyrinogen-III C-methyltransferase [Tahibacter amnicola]UXI68317.1 uroporphyrinogen-III C-methyltransferase [Tahibacter amnicola]